jgi:diacylglycerol kinase
MKQKKFSISKRLESFKYALNGLRILIAEEHNARIHLVAAVCVVIAGLFFNISSYEWIGVILSIGFVFCLEIINTSIENIADFVSPDKHDLIKKTKDLAASGVLISAVTALAVGLVIFLPKLLRLF